MNKEEIRRKIVNEPDAMVVVFRQLIILAKENHIFVPPAVVDITNKLANGYRLTEKQQDVLIRFKQRVMV